VRASALYLCGADIDDAIQEVARERGQQRDDAPHLARFGGGHRGLDRRIGDLCSMWGREKSANTHDNKMKHDASVWIDWANF
jgi:hypothetical protein